MVAPVLGPTLGGWLTDTYSWRYAFYINIPIGVLAVFMISRFVHDPPYIANAKVRPFDGIGFGLLAVWSGCLQVLLDKGQEDDWMGAVWLRWMLFFVVTGFIAFVYRCLKAKDPLVSLKVLKNRNFAVGCGLIFMLGCALYSTITILPLFYQELLGYTAFAAGMVVGPRGIGSILGMPVIAYLGNKMDPRVLLSLGFAGFAVCSLFFANIDLSISPTTLIWPIIASGFALSFVFVPITTQAYGTLSNEQIGNASGIFNLVRNIGGSVGISVAQTELTRRSDFHQNDILNYVPTAGYWFQQRVQAIQGYLGQQTNRANTMAAAQSQIYQQLNSQALLWAFVDVFRWTALLGFFCVLLVWTFAKVKPGKAPAGAH